MKKPKNDPFINLVLDDDEQMIEQALENNEYEDAPSFEETKTMLHDAAQRYIVLQNSKPVTIRINQLDLIKLKAKAKRKQIPYQTLLGALIHDFADGKRDFSL